MDRHVGSPAHLPDVFWFATSVCGGGCRARGACALRGTHARYRMLCCASSVASLTDTSLTLAHLPRDGRFTGGRPATRDTLRCTRKPFCSFTRTCAAISTTSA